MQVKKTPYFLIRCSHKERPGSVPYMEKSVPSSKLSCKLTTGLKKNRSDSCIPLLPRQVLTASYSSRSGHNRGLDSRKQAGIAHHLDRRDTLGYINIRTTLKKRPMQKQGIKDTKISHHCDRTYKSRATKKKIGFFQVQRRSYIKQIAPQIFKFSLFCCLYF